MLKRVYPLLIALMLMSCGGDEPTISSSVNLDVQTTLSLINSHRAAGAECGADTKVSVPGLKWDNALAKAALGHSNDMQQKGYFSHTGQNGSTFSQRVEAAGFEGIPMGENIAAGYPDEEAVITGWMNSEGHCKNIMNGDATHVGVARSAEGSLWTMVLGRKQ